MKKILLILLTISLLVGCSKVTINQQSTQNTYYYEKLESDEERKVYNLVYQALANHQLEVELDNVDLDMDRIFHIATQVSDDHPEFFYFFGDESYESTDYFVYKDAKLALQYAYSLEQIEQYESQLEEIKKEYLSSIQGMNQEEVLEYTYNYLIDQVSYDHQVAETLPDVLDSPNSYGLIGALIDHNCVCAGYAKAFQYLINLAGYHVIYVRGFLDSQSHAWNAVEINGEYYFYDVTSDDINDPEYPNTFYQFFGLNTTQILQHHVLNCEVDQVDSINNNYHVIHGHYIDDINQLDSVLTSQKNQEVITVQCSDYELLMQVYQQLISNKQIHQYISADLIHYTLEDRLFMIQFYINS